MRASHEAISDEPDAQFLFSHESPLQFVPCAVLTAIIAASTSRHVFGFIMVAFGNMQPSQQMCSKAPVGLPASSRSQAPATRTMFIFPFGSLGRQCRPVLSCEPDPFTVASFCAT